MWGRRKDGRAYNKNLQNVNPLTNLVIEKPPKNEPWGSANESIPTSALNVSRIDQLLNSKGTIKNGYGLWIDGKLIVPNKHHPLPEELKRRIDQRENISMPETIKRLRGWTTQDSNHVIKHSEIFKKTNECSACGESFESIGALQRHARRYHS